MTEATTTKLAANGDVDVLLCHVILAVDHPDHVRPLLPHLALQQPHYPLTIASLSQGRPLVLQHHVIEVNICLDSSNHPVR